MLQLAPIAPLFVDLQLQCEGLRGLQAAAAGHRRTEQGGFVFHYALCVLTPVICESKFLIGP
jgi:hypothetical protein